MAAMVHTLFGLRKSAYAVIRDELDREDSRILDHCVQHSAALGAASDEQLPFKWYALGCYVDDGFWDEDM